MPRHPFDDVAQPVGGDDAGVDRLPSWWQLVEPADLHLTVLRQRQCAGDRGRSHREAMRGHSALLGQHQSLADTEAMLLVNDDQPEIAVAHRLLEDRVSSDDYVDAAVEQAHQDGLTRLTLVAPGEPGDEIVRAS